MANKVVQDIGLFIAGLFFVVLAFVLAPGVNQAVQQQYFPVGKYNNQVLKREATDVYLHVWGEKLRECQPIAGSLNSYFRTTGGPRIGIPEDRVSGDPGAKPVGKVDFGVWVIHNVPSNAKYVEMWMAHDCQGTKFSNPLAVNDLDREGVQ